MTQAIDTLVAEHADLERQLSDPELHSNPANARKVGRRFAQLAPIVATHRKLTSARGDLETARELAVDDASFADEIVELETRVAELDTQLTDMLAPRDPHDADDVVLEVKSGEGGEESALFAADLARMYIRYAERHGWNVTVLDDNSRPPAFSRKREFIPIALLASPATTIMKISVLPARMKEVLAEAKPTESLNELHTKYTTHYETNGFAFAAGIGVDYKLNNALAIRVASLDYTRSWTSDLSGVNYQKGMQFTTGMVLRMGTW